MYKSVSALFFLVLSSWSFADVPRVHTATLSDEGLVISGSGFGTDNPMLFWDDAKTEFKATGASIGEEVGVSADSKWTANGNRWGTPLIYSDEIPSQLGRKEVVYYGEGHKNFLGKPNYSAPQSVKNKIYVSWWYRPSQNPNAEGAHNKFIRIWDDTNGNGTRISWTQVVLGAGACEGVWNTWDGYVGEWNHHAIYVDLANGKVKTWLNGRLLHNAECEKHPEFKDVPLYIQVLGFDHGMQDYKGMTTALKDIYIAKTPARVEISDSPTWSEAMDREVLPIQNWDDSKVVAIPHDGAVKLSSDTYVYVVNSDGKTNFEGVKLECENCPTFSVE